jgi:hypothetical protein
METGYMHRHTSKISTHMTNEGSWVTDIIVTRGKRKLVVTYMRGGGGRLGMGCGFCLEQRGHTHFGSAVIPS